MAELPLTLFTSWKVIERLSFAPKQPMNTYPFRKVQFSFFFPWEAWHARVWSRVLHDLSVQVHACVPRPTIPSLRAQCIFSMPKTIPATCRCSITCPTWLMRNPVVVEEMIPAVSPNPLEMPMRKLAYLWRRWLDVETIYDTCSTWTFMKHIFNGKVTWSPAVFITKDIQRDAYSPTLKLSVHRIKS